MTSSLDLTLVEELLPERSPEVTRLGKLLAKKAPPVVTVLGKYNHGKSRLLNELIGSEIFKVADIRQTVTLKKHKHDGVIWLDSPGLDADTSGHDDALANRGAWLEADIRLFVHSAKEGELDLNEAKVLEELQKDSGKTRRQTLIVLTQIDNVPDKSELEKVFAQVKRQAGDVEIAGVSSTRYRKGTDEGKGLLVKESGVPELKHRIGNALKKVEVARTREVREILKVLLKDIARKETCQNKLLDELQKEQKSRLDDFTQKLGALISISRKKFKTAGVPAHLRNPFEL